MWYQKWLLVNVYVFFIVFCIYCKLFLQEIMLKNENFYNFREVIKY